MTQQPLFDDLILEAGRRAFALEHPPEERGAIRLRMRSAYLPTERTAMARDVVAPETWAALTEAGVFALWLLRETKAVSAVLVPRPETSVVANRLHADDHPAVRWSTGLDYWFWDGVWIPQHLAGRRDALHAGDVMAEGNVERRRVLAERVGWERLICDGDGSVIQEDDYGRLWRLDEGFGEEPLVLVDVLDGTAMPSGKRRRYVLRVPPHVRSAREAVAWTFQFERARDYAPYLET